MASSAAAFADDGYGRSQAMVDQFRADQKRIHGDKESVAKSENQKAEIVSQTQRKDNAEKEEQVD